MDCIAKCGEIFTLPIELISSDAATSGRIDFTIRVSVSDSETVQYVNHCMSHLDILSGD